MNDLLRKSTSVYLYIDIKVIITKTMFEEKKIKVLLSIYILILKLASQKNVWSEKDKRPSKKEALGIFPSNSYKNVTYLFLKFWVNG